VLVKTFMANSWTMNIWDMNIKEKVKAEVKVKNFLNLNLIFYQVIKIVYTQRYKKAEYRVSEHSRPRRDEGED